MAPEPSPQAPASDDAGAGRADVAGLPIWMAASLAGLVTAALVRQAPLFMRLARKLGPAAPAGAPAPRHRKAAKPTPEQALPMLADAIVGNTRSAVARVLGPPRSAALSAKKAAPGPATFWVADTWYYPLPHGRRTAMAIRFADDVADAVSFHAAPGA